MEVTEPIRLTVEEESVLDIGDALPAVRAVRENLGGIYAVLRVRHDVAQLREGFLQAFRAIERNSRGGYQIVYNLAQHQKR